MRISNSIWTFSQRERIWDLFVYIHINSPASAFMHILKTSRDLNKTRLLLLNIPKRTNLTWLRCGVGHSSLLLSNLSNLKLLLRWSSLSLCCLRQSLLVKDLGLQGVHDSVASSQCRCSIANSAVQRAMAHPALLTRHLTRLMRPSIALWGQFGPVQSQFFSLFLPVDFRFFLSLRLRAAVVMGWWQQGWTRRFSHSQSSSGPWGQPVGGGALNLEALMIEFGNREDKPWGRRRVLINTCRHGRSVQSHLEWKKSKCHIQYLMES